MPFSFNKSQINWLINHWKFCTDEVILWQTSNSLRSILGCVSNCQHNSNNDNRQFILQTIFCEIYLYVLFKMCALTCSPATLLSLTLTKRRCYSFELLDMCAYVVSVCLYRGSGVCGCSNMSNDAWLIRPLCRTPDDEPITGADGAGWVMRALSLSGEQYWGR